MLMLLMLYSLYNINQGGYLLVDIVYPPEGNHPGCNTSVWNATTS